MPFGAPSVDQYGGDRAGDNLFGNSLVAADANTGKYLWHFQLVHHDLWDADLTSPPMLVDVKQGGKTIPAVVATTKVGLLFILDRVTKVVRVGVYLATSGDFYNQPIIGDAASELLLDAFGEGKTSVRSVLGVASLPLGAPVMLEVMFEVDN